jgi:predicted TIM-barrel fold metal-dependent hydrolase
MVDWDGIEVIDADGHVIEPAVVWKEYSEPAFRDRLDSPGGGVQALGMTRAYPNSTMGLETAADGEGHEEGAGWRSSAMATDTWKEGVRKHLELPGGYDPRARLADMDDEGIDVAVLYPTSMLTWVEEADLFGAACRAYNSWLHDYCAEAPTRLYPVALVPVQDLEAATKELHRSVGELGAKAVMIRPAPYLGTKPLYHSDYDPFWAAVADVGVPIGVHPSPHADMPNSCRLLGLASGVTNGAQGLAMRQGLTNAIDLQMALAWFVLGGICERHPDLRVAFLEGTGGWMVPMLERFDHQFKIFGSNDQKTLPSELFARQCVVSFDPDEAALAFTVEHLGAERVLWASDYPHPDAKIPGVVKELQDALAPLPKDTQRVVAGASARAFYHL